MNFFKRKNKSQENKKFSDSRRQLLTKPFASIVSPAAVEKNIFNAKSKTGYIYVKSNGDIIEDYAPMGGAEPFIGTIMMAGFNFAPVNWLFCNGQTLSIATYNALYLLIGTTYGGNGTTNFALPDLRGRVPLHKGTGPGLSTYTLGQTGGSEYVALTEAQIPAHTHAVRSSTAAGTSSSAEQNYFALNADGINNFANTSDSNLSGTAIGQAGGINNHPNIQPFLALYFSIAVEGVFPTPG